MSGSRNNLQRSGEQGFTLIELLVAVLILLIGIIATVGVFASSKRTTLVAQRHELAVHVAQREMEAMRSLKYSELGLNVTSSGAPQHSNDPDNPNYRVRASDGYFTVNQAGSASTCCEEMVTRSSSDATGGVVKPGGTQADPGEPFTVGEGSGAVTGRIYRYVSWRDENCAILLCDGTHNTKRLIVAVKLDSVGTPPIGPLKPVWATSIASDPNTLPAGSSNPTPTPPPPPATSAQNFYLYEKSCRANDANNAYAAPTASHVTHNTTSDVAACSDTNDWDADGDTDSNDERLDRRPALMGPSAPTFTGSNPPFKFSTDVGPATDYPGGLAMLAKGGSGCPAVSYPLLNSDITTGPSRYSMHAWSTKAFPQGFTLSGRVFLSLWATSVGTTLGTGRFCATLVDRKMNGAVPDDVVLGSMSREYYPWPTTKQEPGENCGDPDFPCGRQLSFSTTIAGASVRTGGRLMLIVTALSTSQKDLVLLYDDPRYRSFLEVETSTPCNATGVPCSNT
jgi:prepilin-type N-terminal cleavage/methylation domain-containing protein